MLDAELDKKCIVFGCSNRKGEGGFIGDICSPCYKMITEGDISQPSNNFIASLVKKDKIYTLEFREKNKSSGGPLISSDTVFISNSSDKLFKEILSSDPGVAK